MQFNSIHFFFPEIFEQKMMVTKSSTHRFRTIALISTATIAKINQSPTLFTLNGEISLIAPTNSILVSSIYPLEKPLTWTRSNVSYYKWHTRH